MSTKHYEVVAWLVVDQTLDYGQPTEKRLDGFIRVETVGSSLFPLFDHRF